jgi:hypothetical protein
MEHHTPVRGSGRRRVRSDALANQERVLPVDAETLAARSAVHQALQRILDRGRRDGTIRADVIARDIIVLTALLAQQLPANRGPDQAPRRLKAFFLDGLAPPGSLKERS